VAERALSPLIPDRSETVLRLRAAGCVFAEDEARLLHEAAAGAAELDELLARRVEGEPLEQILGWAEFGGLRILLDPGVFVPRARTEFLADRAAALLRPGDVAVDLCSGAGAIAAVLAARVPGLDLHAADVQPEAVRCARRNLAGRAQVHVGDLYDALPSELAKSIQVLVANTPYVPTDAIARMPPEARDHEPHLTLDGGPDGLDVQRRIAAGAARWLAPGGYLLVETSDEQSSTAASIFSEHGLVAAVLSDDEVGATVVRGRLPA
jgi:release factor glutamine methyltransferase